MSAVAAAIGGSAILGAVSSNNAAHTQADAANNANALAAQQYQQNRDDTAETRHMGLEAVGQLQDSLGSGDMTRSFNANDFQQDPGYQFRLNQGLGAMQRSASAKGMLNSMGTMQNLNDYAQGQASQEYQGAFDRFQRSQQQRYNVLSGLAGMGNGMTSNMMSMGNQTANQMGQNMMGAGNAMAAGQMGMANAVGGAMGQGANAIMSNQMMNRFMPQPGAPTGAGNMATGSATANWAGGNGGAMSDLITA